MDDNHGSSSGQGQTDGAALGAGVVGVAVAMLIGEGPFSLVSGIIGIALAAVIFGYMGGHRRSLPETVGFAAVIGVVGMPIAGTAIELGLGTHPLANHSGVDVLWLAGIWIVGALLTGVIDGRRNHWWRKSEDG